MSQFIEFTANEKQSLRMEIAMAASNFKMKHRSVLGLIATILSRSDYTLLDIIPALMGLKCGVRLLLNKMVNMAAHDGYYAIKMSAWLEGERYADTLFMEEQLAGPFKTEYRAGLDFFNAWASLDRAVNQIQPAPQLRGLVNYA